MDFYTTPHSTKSKLPSLAFAVGAHAVMLWLAMQAAQVIQHREKHESTYIPVEQLEPIKPIEPKVIVSKDLPPPTQSFFPPPEIPTVPTEIPTIREGTQIAPSHRDFKPTESSGGGGTSTIAVPHTPVHIAAVVDARACDKPEYPPRSLALGEEGTVYLAMLIGPEGQVLESRIEKSSGSKALDKAAVNGLSLCKFKPGTVDGVPEKSWAKLQYAWTIN